MRYTEKEMARLYRPDEPMRFAKGQLTIRADEAERFAPNLVEPDNVAGGYRRANHDSGHETMLIAEAKLRERLRAGTIGPSPWLSSRTK